MYEVFQALIIGDCWMLKVFEISSVKQNVDRAAMLKNWHSDGGVMIMGYDMFRNLTQGSHCKSKNQKKIFSETLVDPGM
jgi:transcriptional regulator ATRX